MTLKCNARTNPASFRMTPKRANKNFDVMLFPTSGWCKSKDFGIFFIVYGLNKAWTSLICVSIYFINVVHKPNILSTFFTLIVAAGAFISSNQNRLISGPIPRYFLKGPACAKNWLN